VGMVRCMELDEDEVLAVMRRLGGTANTREIADGLGCSPDDVWPVLTELLKQRRVAVSGVPR
jgi:hypothetical protein